MAGHDIVVVGASAGGVQAICELVRHLPKNLPASIFLAIHSSPQSPGVLPQIILRAGGIATSYAVDRGPIRSGQIYVAPPDHHLLIEQGMMRLSRGPKENGFRPAVDPLFRTAARSYGSRVVGVVLSGGLDDGTEGLGIIKELGGIAMAQDPAEASFPSMPSSAIQNVDVDYVKPVRTLARILAKVVKRAGSKGAQAMTPNGDRAHDVAEIGDSGMRLHEELGPPSAFTCPECGGALWELRNGRIIQFRCHVGHVYSSDGLLSEKGRDLEMALWTAVRALEEHAGLRRRMAGRAHEQDFDRLRAATKSRRRKPKPTRR